MDGRTLMRESHVRQSYVFTNGGPNTINRSFISTALVNDSLAYGDDLRKSRIQNLPNYKKTNLGQNSQFVLVFQAIQIERLSNEIQVLRVKLKQSERQLFNAQNYEVQIRELTEKCFAYERERQEYRDELDKLNKICQTLYHENQTLKNRLHENDFSLKQKFQSQKQKNAELMQQIDKWKSRYQASEKSKAKELEDLRNLMECQRKSMIDRQIRQITIRFQNQRSNLENQIRKCRQILQNRHREIEQYKQKCQRYQISLMELRNYENVINDNENKILVLNQQLLRLNQVLRNREQQIQAFKQKEYKLNQQIKQQKDWEYDNKQLKANLENRQRQIDQWKVRVSRLQDQAARSKQLQHYNDELANKLNLVAKQIDRLNALLKSKLEQIDQWKKRFTDKEIQVSKYKNLQNDVARYESKFNMIQTENDRINGILKTRLGEIEDWKNRYQKLESTINNYSNIEKDKKALEDKYNKHIKASQQHEFIITKMEKDLNNLRNYQNMAKDLERKNVGFGKEIDRLNGIIRNNSQQLDDFRTRYVRVQTELAQYRNIQNRMKDFENKIALLTQQIERLNDLIKTKNQDIQQLEDQKLTLHQTMTHYKNYELKVNENEQLVGRLQDQIKNIKKDIDVWQSRFKESDIRARQLENHLFLNTQEKEKLSGMVKAKNSEYENLRAKYANLEQNLRKIGHLEMVCQEQHNQIMAYIADIEALNRSSKDYQEQLEKERIMNNEFAYKIIVLSAEIERNSKEGGGKNSKKSKEFQELQENFSRVQSKVQSKNNEVQILLNKISHLQSQVTNLIRDFTRLLNQVEKGERENVLLLKKIEEYQDYAKRIHILGAEIDRLTRENKALDQDAKRIRLKYADNISNEKRQQGFNLITVLMGVQIQSLRNRINEREINLQQMRQSILEPVRRI